MKYLKGLRPTPSLVVSIIALVVACAGGAYAAAQITGNDIKNNSLKSKDIKNKTLKKKDLNKKLRRQLAGNGANGADGANGANGANGSTGPAGPAGPAGADGQDGADAVGNQGPVTNPNWGQIDRNTIGSPNVALRTGPFVGTTEKPPFGIGSLGLSVDGSTSNGSAGAGDEQATFGNEVDFVGDLVSDLDEVGFQVYTTGENCGRSGNPAVCSRPRNLPGIRFEIDPNLAANPTSYSTLVWIPQGIAAADVNQWSDYMDAAATGEEWFLTGSAGTTTSCNQTTYCDLDEIQTALDDGSDPATIYTVGVGKGRDSSWVGSVDGLKVNNTVYDFEPAGVIETTTP